MSALPSLILLAVVGGGAYYLIKQSQSSQPQANNFKHVEDKITPLIIDAPRDRPEPSNPALKGIGTHSIGAGSQLFGQPDPWKLQDIFDPKNWNKK